MTLPCSPDAERFVLGSILLDASFFDQATLPADAFSLEKHRRIFARMGDLNKRGEHIDYMTVVQELSKHGEVESCDGISYLISLTDGLPQVPNIGSYVRIVQQKADLRALALNGQRLQIEACQQNAEPAELIKRFSGTLSEISTAAPEESRMRVGDVIAEEMARVGVEAFWSGSKGIPTPLRSLNKIIVGYQKSDLVLVGARPSVGKTALMLQSATHAARNGHHVDIFSLEMSKFQLSMRMACTAANVDSQLWRLGVLSKEEIRRVMEHIDVLNALPIHIDDASRTADQIHGSIRRTRVNSAVDMAIVDYLQLMSGEGENQNLKIGAISRSLKLTAKEFNIPIIALSQLSRPPKGSNPEPTLQDLRDSGSLEQDADAVVFLHAPDGKLGSGPRKVIVAKQRNGPVGFFDAQFDGEKQTFSEMEGGE